MVGFSTWLEAQEQGVFLTVGYVKGKYYPASDDAIDYVDPGRGRSEFDPDDPRWKTPQETPEPHKEKVEYKKESYPSVRDGLMAFLKVMREKDTGYWSVQHVSLSMVVPDDNRLGVSRTRDLAWWNGRKIEVGPAFRDSPKAMALLQKLPQGVEAHVPTSREQYRTWLQRAQELARREDEFANDKTAT